VKRATPLASRFPGIAAILRNGAVLAGTQWIEAVLRGLYALVIARWLGAELYGAWSFATTTYAFAVALTIFGLDVLLPLRLGRDRQDRSFLGTALLLRLGLIGMACAALGAYALSFEAETATRLALLLVLPALVGRGLVLWSRSVFLGLDRNVTALRLATALRIAEVVSGLTCLALGAGLFTLLAIHSLVWLVEAALSFRAIGRQGPIPLRPSRREVRSLLVEGFPLALAAAGLEMLTAMPLMLTREVTGDLATVGQMAMAMQIATFAVIGAQGLLAAALPVVGRATSRADRRLRYYPGLVALVIAAVFGAAILAALAFGPSIVPAVMGDGFAPSGMFLAPALLVGGMMVLPVGFWQVLAARNRTWSGVVASWSGALALLVLLPPLIRAEGAAGALAAAATAWFLRAVILSLWAVIVIRTDREG
jgi:O-antigen/teichoic acid export membrane protein